MPRLVAISNVIHAGHIVKAGSVIAGATEEHAEDLVKRGLARLEESKRGRPRKSESKDDESSGDDSSEA